MILNPLKELMAKANLTRLQLGQRLGLGHDAISKLLYQLDAPRARICMEIAKQHHLDDLADQFAEMAGIKQREALNLEDLTASEVAWLKKCLAIKRGQKTTIGKLFPEYVEQLYEIEQKK